MKNLLLGSIFFFILAATLATPTVGNSFISDLTYALSEGKTTENVVFSPFSIKSCLGLTYLGAETTTANEIKNIVQFVGSNKEEIAQEFQHILEKAKSSDSAKLKIANRVYVAENYSIAPKFNELASKYFEAAAENVKFSDSTSAANKINSWIEEITNNKIKNLIDPTTLSTDTAAILVNAIYFKGEWKKTFYKPYTEKHDFSVSTTRKVQVDMMYQEDTFLYGKLKDLDAIAVELPYKDTDLAMLIILPNEIDGLVNLEIKLKDIDITKISEQLFEQKVLLYIPKFKVEFDIKLNDILEKLGLNSMFSDAADFSGLLAESGNLSIDEVKHKAFIEVYEAGTEAAAATFIRPKFVSGSMYPTPSFVADHPFFFAIKDHQNVYFAGHVAHL